MLYIGTLIEEDDDAVKLKRWQDKLIVGLATGGFAGYAPVAPGTFGSIVGLGLAWMVGSVALMWQVVLVLLLGGVGVWVSDAACRLFRKADSGRVVIDEIVGMLITMIGIPCTGYWLVVGFLVFRFFDIFKLPPASFFDRKLKNGWGVMLDDGVAGIYANILLNLMLRAQI